MKCFKCKYHKKERTNIYCTHWHLGGNAKVIGKDLKQLNPQYSFVTGMESKKDCSYFEALNHKED